MKLVETYTGYRGDEALVELVLSIYKYIQSSPFPDKWLTEKVEMFHVDENRDFSETIWSEIILQETKGILEDGIVRLTKIKNDTLRFVELEQYSNVLEQDIQGLRSIYEHTNNWDETYHQLLTMSWAKWPVNRKVTLDLKNEAKEIRDKVKKQISSIKVTQNSQEAIEDINGMYEILKELQKLIQEFAQSFADKKKEKNMIDFNDIEHFALKILIQQTEEGIKSTEVAKKYRDKFAEIAIDEYQDSNLVQEYILNSISNGNNMFMVGDVKQSIYKFRQARPELFLEKYATYQLKENKQEENGLKIQLFKNFRSRENVLEITNLVFEDIMSHELGNVEYTEEEYLNYGANYPEPEESLKEGKNTENQERSLTSKIEEKSSFGGIAELDIINLKEELELDIYKTNSQSENEQVKQKQKAEIASIEQKNTENGKEERTETEEERVENAVLEARFVAHRIKKLLDSGYMVFDKKIGYRKITYKDICILLRATSAAAPIYEKEIAELDLPVFSDTSSTYLESMEVQIIMALLKIIDNPMQDIPLVTVLRSSIGGFNDNELIQIRLADRNSTFYEAMLKARLVVNENLKNKIEKLLQNLNTWRKEEEYLPLDELIWKLYTDTGFYHYVSLLTNGDLRQANLKLLFEKAKQYEKASFKGLFNFIQFIDKVKTSSGDMGSAKLIGENDNVIRIMSIHKSKGLEFPVVFLCGTGKQFNLQDLNKPILLHQDIGFGPKFIDSEKRIEYNTLAGEAIRIQTKRETISEEMRVLYVALTRAKERLIITGLSKDLHKSLQEKEELLNTYESSKGKINSKLVEKYVSYLDWLELVYLHHKEKMSNIMELKEYKKSDILKEIQKQEKMEVNIEDLLKYEETEGQKKQKELIEEKLKWSYPYIKSSEIPTKTSVTKLKQMQEEINRIEILDIEDLIKMKKSEELRSEKIQKLQTQDSKDEQTKTENQKQINLTAIPKFMEKKQELTAMQKGTLMHLCIQKLDENKEYSKEGIEQFIQGLYENGIISEVEKNAVNRQAIYEYTKSTLWQELKEAKEIHKEEPFYINLPAKTIYKEAGEKENILVQGIIDLYYINKENKLILVDFKTDHIQKGEEYKLEEKYKVQLELYKQALEEALHKKVEKAMIYALS